jgi:hypothetical protein
VLAGEHGELGEGEELEERDALEHAR